MDGVDETKWVVDTKDWYEGLPPTESSMLNGLMHVHEADIGISKKLLVDTVLPRLRDKPDEERSVLDCGSGIGRTVKAVLNGHFGHIDLVDISANQLEGSKAYLDGISAVKGRFNVSLDQLDLPKSREGCYDVMWAQWSLCHLPDDDFVRFLLFSRKYMSPDGRLVIVDNTLEESEDPSFNENYQCDHMILRHPQHIKTLLGYAGWVVEYMERQPYPDDICPVWAFISRMLTDEECEEWLEPGGEGEDGLEDDLIDDEISSQEGDNKDIYYSSEEY